MSKSKREKKEEQLRLKRAASTVSPSQGVLAQLVRAPPCHGGGCGFEPRRLRIVRRSSSHDVNGQNAALMAREQIIDKIANNRVRFVAQLRHDATNQSAAAAVPFQINCSVNISRAMDLGPTMRTSGLFRPDFDEPKFSLQLRIVHYLGAQ